MLEVLRIQHLALMESVEVTFGEGLNIVTGETGSGKSNLLEAIDLLLGSRGRLDLIRKGSESCTVEGVFDLKATPWISTRLDEQGLRGFAEDERLFVRRILHASGKNRVYINGALCSLQQLVAIADGLIDFCSQHEHQTLMRPSVQQELVDGFGGLHADATKLDGLLKDLRAAREILTRTDLYQAEFARKIEFLKFQIDEIDRANLKVGEDIELQEERKRIQQHSQRKQAFMDAVAILEQLTSLKKVEHLLQPLEADYANRVQKLRYETEDLLEVLRRDLEVGDVSPERSECIEERLFQLQQLKRKYGPDVPSIMQLRQNLSEELVKLADQDQPRPVLVQNLEKAEAAVKVHFDALLKKRSTAAQKLAMKVTKELKDLCIDRAAFEIRVHAQGDFRTETEFMIRTNAGEDLRPLMRVASGGELSRVMLAIRRVCVDGGKIGVYLFDEIDAGLGGTIAYHVGKKLKQVAKHHQILCVTHLPQVAAFADGHFHVTKSRQGERTVSRVMQVVGESQVLELARMMSGPAQTAVSRQNALELLQSTT